MSPHINSSITLQGLNLQIRAFFFFFFVLSYLRDGRKESEKTVTRHLVGGGSKASGEEQEGGGFKTKLTNNVGNDKEAEVGNTSLSISDCQGRSR